TDSQILLMTSIFPAAMFHSGAPTGASTPSHACSRPWSTISHSLSTLTTPPPSALFHFLHPLHYHLHGLVRHGSAADLAKRCIKPNKHAFATRTAPLWHIVVRLSHVFPLTPPRLLHLLPADGPEGGLSCFQNVLEF